MTTSAGPTSLSLLDLLSNSLVLHHISPYIGVPGLLSLAITSKSFRSLVLATPQVFHRLDLSPVTSRLHSAAEEQPRRSYYDEQVSPGSPFPCVRAHYYFSSHNLAKNIRTLILDGSYVPFPLLSGFLMDETYHIRLISLRSMTKMDDYMLTQLLRYLIRPSRPSGIPRLKGVYHFLPMDESFKAAARPTASTLPTVSITGVTNSIGAQLAATTLEEPSNEDQALQTVAKTWDPWYGSAGTVLPGSLIPEWADLVEACEGIIAFDATICRHDRDRYGDPRPKLATVRLNGCKSCGSCPEGPASLDLSPESHLPLVPPPPLHAYTVKVAQRPENFPDQHSSPTFIARCFLCLKNRWCEACNAWWCEDCYTPPSRKAPTEPSTEVPPAASAPNAEIKVYNGLCIANCLRNQLLSTGGEGGMWG